MNNCSDRPWSNGPNAPRLSYYIYIQEKGDLTGSVVAAIFYGIVVALFFQCMSALLFPVHPTTKGVRWGLVAYAVTMFSFATIGVAIDRDILSLSYIDDREFGGAIPGPIGFLNSVSLNRRAFVYVPYPMFPITQWLADGLLLYRCFVICSKNYWVITFPSLLYLVSIGYDRCLRCYHNAKEDDSWHVYDMAYFAICVSLNVLLTLMIIIRLALHISIRIALGTSSGLGSLYTAVITMLVESSALSAVGYLLHIVSASANSCIPCIFFPSLGEIQIISQFLIVLRVTNRSALTSEAVASGNVSLIHFRCGGGSTGGYVGSNGETFGRIGLGVETGSEET